MERRTADLPTHRQAEPRYRRARACADALGTNSVLGQRSNHRTAHHQRQKQRRLRPRLRFGRQYSTGAASCPSGAFYEWQKLDAKTKQPFAIALKGNELYAFKGLWERWRDRQAGQDLLTFTIITTDPNEVVQPLHNRMPVIIPAKDYDRWLKPGDPARPPVDLLRPFDADKMIAWRVDRAVGNVKNDRPELIEPSVSSEPSEDSPSETLGLLLGVSGQAK
jgi:putative SOS response-associated peptidase YedK